MNRAAGILLPITSLPSKYGIGCFSKSAYDFADWLKKAGQTYWQILPLGPTSYGDSPYQSFSTFAGNPYFISLEALMEEGVLTTEECDEAEFSFDDYYCDYISGGAAGYHFLVKNDLTVSTDSDKQDVEETIKKYKNITEVDFHLNDVAEILYDEEDREWIFENDKKNQ